MSLDSVWHKVNVMILDEQWRKATKSNNNGACAEIRRDGDGVQIRDSKNPTGAVLTFTAEEWDAFCDGVEKGEFRLA